MPMLFDTHAHFPLDPVAIEGLLDRARDAGVARIVAVGGNPELNAGARLAAAARPEQVLLALGFDREQAAREESRAEVAAVFADIACPSISAIGEIGLDYHYHRDETARKAQRELMECQMEIAAHLAKPVIIHTRDADADTLALLRNVQNLPWFCGGRPGVIHCFTGGQLFADELLALGYYLSFSGIVTFANAAPLRAVARTVPEDCLLIETDSPYLTPVPLRGRPNEPAHVLHVAACLAEQRSIAPETLAARTTANALRLFGKA